MLPALYTTTIEQMPEIASVDDEDWMVVQQPSGATGKSRAGHLRNGGLREQLSSSAGAGYVKMLRPDLGAKLRPIDLILQDRVSVMDFIPVITNTAIADCTAYANAAEDACLASGKALYWPAGTYRFNSGIIKKNVTWYGDGKDKTLLDYRGSGVFIDATGTNAARIRSTIANIGLIGWDASDDSVCITFGWNQRSTPLQNVDIGGFGRYGIHFNDWNWIVSFYDVLVNQCGGRFTNGAGLFKDPSVDGSTWNDIKFYSLNVENCGRVADSTAGGILFPSNTANRGLYFINCDIEGNRGSYEVYISNTADVQFHDIYMETSVTGATADAVGGIRLEACGAAFHGGYMSGSDGTKNLTGIEVGGGGGEFAGQEVAIFGLSILNYAASIRGQDNRKIGLYSLRGDKILVNTDNTAQFFGDITPRVSAHKNSINQTGVVANVFTKVTFGTERYDKTAAFTGSTFTPRLKGVYGVNAQVAWTAGVDLDELIIAIYVNGAAVRYGYTRASGTGQQVVSISADIPINSHSDAVEIWVRQTSGVDQVIEGSEAYTWLMISYAGDF